MPPVSSCFWGLWRVREKNKKLHYHFIDFMHCCVFPVCLRYWGCYQCTIWCSWWHCCSQGHQEKTGDDINLRKGLEPSCISLYFSKFFFGYWLLLHSFFNPVFLSDLIKAEKGTWQSTYRRTLLLQAFLILAACQKNEFLVFWKHKKC